MIKWVLPWLCSSNSFFYHSYYLFTFHLIIYFWNYATIPDFKIPLHFLDTLNKASSIECIRLFVHVIKIMWVQIPHCSLFNCGNWKSFLINRWLLLIIIKIFVIFTWLIWLFCYLISYTAIRLIDEACDTLWLFFFFECSTS